MYFFSPKVTGMKSFIKPLFVQARKWSEESQKALANIENSHQRAKDLDTETQNLQRKIQGKNIFTLALILIII